MAKMSHVRTATKRNGVVVYKRNGQPRVKPSLYYYAEDDDELRAFRVGTHCSTEVIKATKRVIITEVWADSLGENAWGDSRSDESQLRGGAVRRELKHSSRKVGLGWLPVIEACPCLYIPLTDGRSGYRFTWDISHVDFDKPLSPDPAQADFEFKGQVFTKVLEVCAPMHRKFRGVSDECVQAAHNLYHSTKQKGRIEALTVLLGKSKSTVRRIVNGGS